MEIGTMSAEELAKSFESKTQNQNQEQNQNQSQEVVVIGDRTAEQLAKEFEEGKHKQTNPSDPTKTPEQLADEAAALAAAEAEKDKESKKTKLDDSFKQGLDKLFKENKLNPYSDGTETGYIVPETFEDVLELIEENKKSWVAGAKAKDREELVDEILATKSPAWKFLIQNSENYKDPADLIPLITAVQNQEYSNSLDPKEVTDQEKIIRASLSIQGLPPQAIEDEITDLKERNKLEKRATDLKPVLDKFNANQTAQEIDRKNKEDQKTEAFWNKHYQNLEDTVFKSKDLDGVKLKNEHKQLIASALIPNEEAGGLPIYTILDNLIAQGNFKVLSKMALLGLDEKLFDTYFLTKKADKVADGVQKVLRQSGTSSSSTDLELDQKKVTPMKKSYGYFG